MRRKDREITDINQIEDIILNSTVCRLGLSDINIPYVVPMNFGYKNKTLYLHSSSRGKKIDIIHKNPVVCVEFDIPGTLAESKKPCDWGMHYQSVIAFGMAEILKNHDHIIQGLDIIMNQYSGHNQNYNYMDSVLKKIALIKVTINSFTGKRTDG